MPVFDLDLSLLVISVNTTTYPSFLMQASESGSGSESATAANRVSTRRDALDALSAADHAMTQ